MAEELVAAFSWPAGLAAAEAHISFASVSEFSYLEVLHYDGPEEKIVCNEGILDDQLLPAWLSKDINRDIISESLEGNTATCRFAGGLRLLFTGRHPSQVFSFSEDAYSQVAKSFGLPVEFKSLLNNFGTSTAFRRSFHRTNQTYIQPSDCYIFNFSTFNTQCQLALSYSKTPHVISGFIVSKYGKYKNRHLIPRIIQDVKRLTAQSLHPLLTAVVVIGHGLENIDYRIKFAERNIKILEESLGQHEHIGRPVGNPLSPDFDLHATTRRLNFISQIVAAEKMRSEAKMLELEMILKETKSIDQYNLIIQRPSSEGQMREERTYQDSMVVQELIQMHTNFCQNLLLAAEYEAKRIEIQIAVVYQFIAQKDAKVNIELAATSATIAKESKKDSASMKVIAVLTMLFIPATFLAAMFAMPVFNWDDNNLPFVGRGFRLYWIIAIPLTLGVVIVWALARCLPWIKWVDMVRYRGADLEAGEFDRMKRD